MVFVIYKKRNSSDAASFCAKENGSIVIMMENEINNFLNINTLL